MKQVVNKVYRFKTNQGEIIYVGKTKRLTVDRFYEHAKDKYWINEVVEVEDCTADNPANASSMESYFINLWKPLFNIKDKEEGKVEDLSKSKQKKFSHAFYVLNGVPTTCVTSFKDKYVLVDFIELNSHHVGVYYDEHFNLLFSMNDICEALNIASAKFKKFLGEQREHFSCNYEIVVKGKTKEKTMYFCDYWIANLLIDLGKDRDLVELCNEKLYDIYLNTDLTEAYKEKEQLDKALELYNEILDQSEITQSHIRRRIVYKHLFNLCTIEEVIEEHNEYMREYNFKLPLEREAADIFSMVDDLVNEFNTEHYEVFKSFNEYLMKNNNLNFWSIRKNLSKTLNTDELKFQYIVALRKDILLKPFEDFYESSLESRFDSFALA